MAILGTNSALGKLATAAVTGLQTTAAKPNNDLSSTAVADAKIDIKREIERAIVDAPTLLGVAVVDVKSAFLSKINWTQAIGWAASGIVAFLLPYVTSVGLPEQVVALFTVQTVTAVLTWLFKTFFTSTVTPSSLPAAP